MGAVETELTSTANPRVKALVRLRGRRARDDAGVTLVEGYAELRLALAAGVRPRELWWAPEIARPGDVGLAAELRAAGARVTAVSAEVFARVAYRESPDGWLAVVPAPGRALADLAPGRDPLLLVAEAVEKPGNLGALVRTAEACGAAAAISASGVTDLGNPNVVRASKGTVFALPVAAAPSTEVLAWLGGRGARVVVTTPAGSTPLPDADLTGPVALVVGAESTGVSDLWLEHADVTVVIPLLGRVNSLNAAAAGAMALYEAMRQRR